MSKFGNNLQFILNEIGDTDPEYFDNSTVEIFGEDDEGNEGSCEVDIIDACAEAAEQLKAKDKEIAQLKSAIKRLGSSVAFDIPTLRINGETRMRMQYARDALTNRGAR